MQSQEQPAGGAVDLSEEAEEKCRILICTVLHFSVCKIESNVAIKQSVILCLQRDLSYLKQEFSKVYMSSVYFLLHTPSLPCYRWADPPSEEQRARVIYSTLEALKNSQQATGQSASPGVFFDSSHSHLAFDVQELTFDLLSARR